MQKFTKKYIIFFVLIFVFFAYNEIGNPIFYPNETENCFVSDAPRYQNIFFMLGNYGLMIGAMIYGGKATEELTLHIKETKTLLTKTDK